MPKNYSADGRKKVGDLYKTFDRLVGAGFIQEEICNSREFPIMSYKTRQEGKALWLLAGIHGEEPAGPNALAEGINIIQKLSEKYPLVVLPLCNPSGYDRNWRYLNRKDYQDNVVRQSIGDADHYMIAKEKIEKFITIAKRPTSPEAGKLIDHILQLTKTHLPIVAVDFHEDDCLSKCYVYSQGQYETKDHLAIEVLGVLEKNIPIQMDGESPNHELITNGLIGTVNDLSIDQFLALDEIIVDGIIVPGPATRTVLALETPSTVFPLKKRIDTYLSVLEYLTRADLGM